MVEKKYLCSWSGGKDSTASIILAHLHNEPLDTILFSEVMYDKRRNISGENPRHINFIINKAKPLFESWGYEVKILRAERDYLDCFNRIIEKPRKHPDHKNKKFGFALTGLCGIKRDCKLKPIKDFCQNIKEPIVQYVGICSDEPIRLKSLHKSDNNVSLLEKYNYTEQMAKELCIEYDLLSPCYELSNRGGCFFCPNAKIEEHREIKKLYPDVWNEFVALEDEDNVANSKWSIYHGTLKERDEKLSC